MTVFLSGFEKLENDRRRCDARLRELDRARDAEALGGAALCRDIHPAAGVKAALLEWRDHAKVGGAVDYCLGDDHDIYLSVLFCLVSLKKIKAIPQFWK